MIDFKELENDGERWEQFARDFFSALGYKIENPPDRGADGGRDLLVSEFVKGNFSSYCVRWLVSCKNNVHSGKAVSEDDEKNLLERCKGFKCNGFIGFYSTILSSGLGRRLAQLVDSGDLSDYLIFDSAKIENCLIEFGMSNLIFQYFPESYKILRPVHEIFDGLVDLKCDFCGKDLLDDVVLRTDRALVAEVGHYDEKTGITEIRDIYFACKGECDMVLENRAMSDGKTFTTWRDISDLAKPNLYLQYLLALINQLHDKSYIYSDKAIDKEKHLIVALAQKVFHEVTPKEKEELRELFRSGLI